MDLANNRVGLIDAERLRKAGALTETRIEEKAMEAIKLKRLIVLEAQVGKKNDNPT